MTSRSLPRLLRTLWYLRPEQWVGQVRRMVPWQAGPVRLGGSAPRLRFEEPFVPWLPAPPHALCASAGRVRLINREARIPEGPRWDFAQLGPLFAYHVHQFDWARSPGLTARDRASALHSWIANHREGTGWQAGPISLRSFAWIKLLTTPGALPEAVGPRAEILRSLADQLATLEGCLERHLLANHYLWNLLALVFAGTTLDGSRADAWWSHVPPLLAELEEEILPDGAHFERSPMYHALLLENLLDILNALLVARPPDGDALAKALSDTTARMLGALQVWTCPDGEIALFGDSAFGIAHPPASLLSYAAALGITPTGPEPSGVLLQAGFVRLAAGPFTLIASAAAPMPSYQPGHAHCDALSFVLSVGRERVVTDTGVYEYVPGQRRDLARATRSHATVKVNGRDQAEVWAAHRIGGRPDAAFTRIEPGSFAEGVCAGWATPEVLHRRRFQVKEDEVVLEDTFDLPAERARLQLPLAPGIEVELSGSHAVLRLESGRTLRIELPPAARWRVDRGPYYPEFGLEIERAVLVGEAERLVEARWRLFLAGPAARDASPGITRAHE